VACAGADAERAERLARRLLDRGCDALVSFGVAGGLDPRLAAGDLVVAEAVLTPDGRRLETDPEWRRRVAARCRPAVSSGAWLAGVERPVAGPADKAALRQRTGAVAADMESHRVGLVASARGVPFLAVRAIADPAARSVPEWLMAAIDETGGTRALVAVRGAVTRPWQIPGLIRLGREFDAAIATLSRVAVDARPALLAVAE
jgi:adenosylhomocysteine nucleosidase